MITAILIDKKGFQKSIQIPDIWPEVNIPLYESPDIENIQPGNIAPNDHRSMTFVKEEVLGYIAYGSKVVTYKEKK